MRSEERNKGKKKGEEGEGEGRQILNTHSSRDINK